MSTFLVGIVVLAAIAVAVGAEDSCIAMRDITSVHFDASMTQARIRSPNVPRLQCVGNCPSEARLDGAMCTQVGSGDDGLPSWRCVPNFAPSPSGRRFGLGNIKVECEGCTKRGDPNVRTGSCSLRYSVVVGGAGRSMGRSSAHHRGRAVTTTTHHVSEGDVIFDFLVLVLLLAGCCGAVYAFGRRRGRQEHYPYPPAQYAYGKDASGAPVMGTPIGPAYHSGGGGSGFGTGLVGGMLLGHMMSHGGATHHYHHYDDDGYGGGGGDDWGASDGGGWGGGGDGWGGSDSV